jgi:hypothetical protein
MGIEPEILLKIDSDPDPFPLADGIPDSGVRARAIIGDTRQRPIHGHGAP